MEPWGWILLIAVVVVAVAAVAWMFRQKRRTEQLREGFGPEYQRAVDEHGDRRRAEAELAERRKRVEKLDIRPLSRADHDRFAEQWRATQAGFVDSPPAAIAEADLLVTDVMVTRGYPMGDFEQRSADVSVDHPHVVANYRSAHGISEASARGEASTEDLRQAMVHYRALFDDLLEARVLAQMESRR
jgi:hypothetical protein